MQYSFYAICYIIYIALLDHSDKNIRKETCWTLSNITAGNQTQIAMVIAVGVIPRLIVLLQTDAAPMDIQKEAAWVIANAASGGSAEQVSNSYKAIMNNEKDRLYFNNRFYT